MIQSDQAIYTLLLWTMPALLAILGFVGALAVNQLMKLSDSVNEIKITIGQIAIKHDDLKERVDKLEGKLK